LRPNCRPEREGRAHARKRMRLSIARSPPEGPLDSRGDAAVVASPMRVLTRYLLREITLPLVITTALAVIIGGTSQLVRAASDVGGIGIPMSTLLSALPLAMPSLFGMGMPIAFMLAMLVAFGRLAEERELLALSASGISMRRLLVVPLSMGVFLTGLGLVMTLWAEPAAIMELRSLLADAAAGYFGQGLEAGVLHDQVPGVTIYFDKKDAETGALTQIVLIDEREGAEPRLFTAAHGMIDKRDGALRFVLQDGEVHMGRPKDPLYRLVRFDELVWRVDPGPLIRRISSQIPSVNSLSVEELMARAADPSLSAREHLHYTVTLHRKFTFPFGNLVFVLLAFPITTIYNRTSRLFIYAAVAGMAALYFTLTQTIDPLVNNLGLSPAQATWVPNALFGAIGIVLTVLRIRR
jgi:lipopolysaccharide export system permease protein